MLGFNVFGKYTHKRKEDQLPFNDFPGNGYEIIVLGFLLNCCFVLFEGIWPEGADGTDINAVCRSHDNNLLASADDFGKVHLFSNPCSLPRVSCFLLNLSLDQIGV